jgi:hypothetical protein
MGCMFLGVQVIKHHGVKFSKKLGKWHESSTIFALNNFPDPLEKPKVLEILHILLLSTIVLCYILTDDTTMPTAVDLNFSACQIPRLPRLFRDSTIDAEKRQASSAGSRFLSARQPETLRLQNVHVNFFHARVTLVLFQSRLMSIMGGLNRDCALLSSARHWVPDNAPRQSHRQPSDSRPLLGKVKLGRHQ